MPKTCRSTTPTATVLVESQDRHARAFTADDPLITTFEARVRYREGRERASLVASGVPQPRVRQILTSVLALPCFKGIEPHFLRLDVYRSEDVKYSNDYGLAVAMSLVAALIEHPIPPSMLFVGDVDLAGRVRDVSPKLIDALNHVISRFEIESPVTIVAAPASVAWINASSTVRAVPAVTLLDAVRAVWSANPPRN